MKGARAPFFSDPICAPRLRDDALLSGAIVAFEAGHHADALLAAEYVCRRFPEKCLPAILRAKIVQACRPELTAKAWYNAWCCDPENPALQDVMLRAWLASGAASTVAELGPAFLPARCRAGLHAPLVELLRQAGVSAFGACWKDGDAIEGMLFAPAAPIGTPQRLRLTVANFEHRYCYDVPADGSRFRLACPSPHQVWSLTFERGDGAAHLMHGSPLAFAAAPAAPTAPDRAKSARLASSPSRASASAPTAALAARTPSLTQAGTAPACAAPPQPADRAPISIIIPVYRDQALVQACIASVLASLAHNRSCAELVVIDDASPEPALSAWLDTQAAAGRLTLLRNVNNLGFIETVNRGLRQHPGHDALLLNADTLVHGDWIDRLAAALASAPDIASVTPWSNNGEISSFPKIASATPPPSPAELARIDAIAATLHQSGASADVELPVCCGFTMLMRRSVIDQIGALDGVGLIRGYGEEVDWCLRARAAGFRHLAATGVFVAHTGTVSFRFEKTLRVRQNRLVLAARYPDFHAQYRRLLHDDPLAGARAALRAGLEQSANGWLAGALNLIEGATEFARALPAPLASSCTRIAVWHHRLSAPGASEVLALARLIASADPSAPALRLLIIGEASEALWHTGVVDVVPSAPWKEAALLTDAALIGLAGCRTLLTESAIAAPVGIEQTRIDADFEARAWLHAWRQRQSSPPSRKKKKAA
jgi:GT2 family glycosyltransferase